MNKKRIYNLIGIAFLILVWIILSLTLNSYAVPKISEVLKELFKILIDIHSYKVILATLGRLLAALAISFIIGVFLAILSFKSNAVKEILSPIISVLRCVPVVAVIIIILMIASVKLASVIITILVTLPIIYTTILTGFFGIDKGIIDDLLTMDNINIRSAFNVLLPVSKKNVEGALISATGLGFKVIVMSEFIASPLYSIAREMGNDQATFNMAGIFAWTILMLIFVFILEHFINKLKPSVNKKRR